MFIFQVFSNVNSHFWGRSPCKSRGNLKHAKFYFWSMKKAPEKISKRQINIFEVFKHQSICCKPYHLARCRHQQHFLEIKIVLCTGWAGKTMIENSILDRKILVIALLYQMDGSENNHWEYIYMFGHICNMRVYICNVHKCTYISVYTVCSMLVWKVPTENAGYWFKKRSKSESSTDEASQM